MIGCGQWLHWRSGGKWYPTCQTQTAHMGIAYAHLTASYTCDYMGNVRYVEHAAKSSKNHIWLLGLEYAKFSLHEKWNNCSHPYRTVIASWITYHQPSENISLGFILGFQGRDISYKIHSFLSFTQVGQHILDIMLYTFYFRFFACKIS